MCDSACVSGSAHVCESARVRGDGDIAATNDWITVGPVGRDANLLTLHRDRLIGIRINRGCFSGSLREFMAQLLPDCESHDAYRQIVPMLHAVLKARMTPLDSAWNTKWDEGSEG